jgi:hypothetical protein
VAAVVVALGLAGGAVIQTAVLSAHWTPLSGQAFDKVSTASATELAYVDRHISSTDETIVSQGVVGRFSQRHTYYPYFDVFANGQTVPLFGRTVDVILAPTAGIEPAPVTGTMAGVALMRHLGAHQIADSHGVYAFAWRVPKGRHSITFPP